MTVPAELHGLLEYLDGIGYGDIYIRPRARPAALEGSAFEVVGKPAASMGEVLRTTAPMVGIASSPAAELALPADPADPAARLQEIAAEAAGCTRCKLAAGRKNVVFGSGNPHARLMLIGEAPGAEEDKTGLPFVGAAGELLTKILAAIGLTRDEVYIANVLKCRPPGNRDPEADEVAACRGYLEAQIRLVAPELLVILGRIAAQTLLGTDTALGRLRGRWHQISGVPAMVTYHPAALLRNAEYKRPTWEDMQLVRDRLKG